MSLYLGVSEVIAIFPQYPRPFEHWVTYISRIGYKPFPFHLIEQEHVVDLQWQNNQRQNYYNSRASPNSQQNEIPALHGFQQEWQPLEKGLKEVSTLLYISSSRDCLLTSMSITWYHSRLVVSSLLRVICPRRLLCTMSNGSDVLRPLREALKKQVRVPIGCTVNRPFVWL